MIDTSRFKNYGLWLSISTLISLILQGFQIEILPDNYQEIVNVILSIMALIGVINHPTSNCNENINNRNKINNENY
ncbi:phage holin [Clostridium perfringens]|uniref:phage holin n=1 Tax=Clostridium perfringens TaxID=1502 RepID=UPI0024BD0837|nr:phage holin [Clostridium perfringens]MDK0651581.1 phage holin [Clostridium perfringens]MDM0627422.1 phage holin [Clostridium perfringens]